MMITPPRKKHTTHEAWQLFDNGASVNVEFMLGRWQGAGFHTDHPMDGLLETSGWYGKEFVDAENVHPLLFLDRRGQIFKVAANYLMINCALKFPILQSERLQSLRILANSLLRTKYSQARLRMVEYRGQVSATMLYDYLPINDYFRKIDDNAVLGVMDFKQSPQPLFFILKRC